jgi:hypothetical protein
MSDVADEAAGQAFPVLRLIDQNKEVSKTRRIKSNVLKKWIRSANIKSSQKARLFGS